VQVDYESIKTFASTYGSTIASFLVNFLKNSLGSIPGLVTNIILFIYIFTALLMYNKQLVRYTKQLNPMGDEVSNLYLSRAAAMTKGMVRGQFIIAFAQGITGALFLYIAGLHYFAPLALVLSLLSIIPLGGGIVSIPIGIVLLVTGNVLGGLLVLVGHFLVVTNIDNILRPKLVPKEARLNSALTMLSVFSGIAFFGFLGIVIGPVLMILIVTTIQVYITTRTTKS
jgi:predicted PurR-regulated permease PerM